MIKINEENQLEGNCAALGMIVFPRSMMIGSRWRHGDDSMTCATCCSKKKAAWVR